MIRRCEDSDSEVIWTIINDGAQAYKGVIPADQWTEPYMSREEMQHEISDGRYGDSKGAGRDSSFDTLM
jgi:hypothetical protein